MNGIRERLLAAFDIEHRDHLAALRDALPADGGTERAPPDLVELHRRMHSLKGAARAVDLPDVEAVAHRLESVLTAVQRGALVLDGPVRCLVRQALDTIEDVAAAAIHGGPAIEAGAVVGALDRLAGPHGGPPALPRAAPAAAVEAGGADGVPDRRLVRINSRGLERLLDTAAALLPEMETQARLAQDLRRLARDWASLEESWRRLRRHLKGDPETVFAEAVSVFERRFRAVGGSLAASRRGQDRGLWALRRWGGGLAEDVRRLRTVPAETQFAGLGRMVRDLARSLGKEVEFDMRGLDVEADRAVLQALRDPVIHLLRNAVGHGVEAPEERIAAGKRPAGRLGLEMAVVAGRLVLRVVDDGWGIDPVAIGRRAAECGLVSAAEADGLTVERAARLLFEPGFSTAPEVTEIAGRGMGLAIVQQEVARLQGAVRLAPRDGGGTTLTIDVPVSLSAQRVLLVTAADQTFAVAASAVLRLRRVPVADLVPLGGGLVLPDGEEAVPVVPLAAVLGLRETPLVGLLAVALVGVGGRRIALVVESFQASRDAVVTAIDELGLDPRRFTGTVLLEDGSPALVLNIAGLLTAGWAAGWVGAGATTVSEAQPRRPRILVVDDSITTRTLERSILEAHGFDVALCVDGREALERLREEAVDLIVSDVEMPRMDGFALLQAVRGDPRTSDLPVILVTSRASAEDRERGLCLRADAYIVKTRFNQDELIEGIRRLL